jgi:N-acetyl-anhydromuramyl-L-alanine amidase AmpD
MGKVTRITVHHSGEVNDMNSEQEIITHLRNVQASQCRTKAAGGLGAGDLAYHFIIDRNGETWEGRSLDYQGAHAGNSLANRGNIGVCVLGSFNVQYPNERQKDSLKALLRRLTQRYGLTEREIYTHREIRAYYGLAATECPGSHLQSVVDAMRREPMGNRSLASVH